MKRGRAKVREMFEQNRHVTDIRVIDMLVIKVSNALCIVIVNRVIQVKFYSGNQ